MRVSRVACSATGKDGPEQARGRLIPPTQRGGQQQGQARGAPHHLGICPREHVQRVIAPPVAHQRERARAAPLRAQLRVGSLTIDLRTRAASVGKGCLRRGAYDCRRRRSWSWCTLLPLTMLPMPGTCESTTKTLSAKIVTESEVLSPSTSCGERAGDSSGEGRDSLATKLTRQQRLGHAAWALQRSNLGKPLPILTKSSWNAGDGTAVRPSAPAIRIGWSNRVVEQRSRQRGGGSLTGEVADAAYPTREASGAGGCPAHGYAGSALGAGRRATDGSADTCFSRPDRSSADEQRQHVHRQASRACPEGVGPGAMESPALAAPAVTSAAKTKRRRKKSAKTATSAEAGAAQPSGASNGKRQKRPRDDAAAGAAEAAKTSSAAAAPAAEDAAAKRVRFSGGEAAAVAQTPSSAKERPQPRSAASTAGATPAPVSKTVSKTAGRDAASKASVKRRQRRKRAGPGGLQAADLIKALEATAAAEVAKAARRAAPAPGSSSAASEAVAADAAGAPVVSAEPKDLLAALRDAHAALSAAASQHARAAADSMAMAARVKEVLAAAKAASD
ncbi:unnamed protein product, partial [Symbiodinium sp. KB8]